MNPLTYYLAMDKRMSGGEVFNHVVAMPTIVMTRAGLQSVLCFCHNANSVVHWAEPE